MVIVLCNAPPADAERIARALVDARLAACVNVIAGVVSVYRWKGETVCEPESTLIIKSRPELLERLRETLGSVHPYEVPEIVALRVNPDDVNASYLGWLRGELADAP
jgi:periplasmic divalent cation tolerance protein